MKPTQDAFGQVLWSYFQEKEGFQVLERDDDYIDVIDPEPYFREYEAWSRSAKKKQ